MKDKILAILNEAITQLKDPVPLLKKALQSKLILSWVFFIIILIVVVCWMSPSDKEPEETTPPAKTEEATGKKPANQTPNADSAKPDAESTPKAETVPGKAAQAKAGSLSPTKAAKKEETKNLAPPEPEPFKPSLLYRRPNRKYDDHHVAIIIKDVGLSADLTKQAMEKTPKEVCISFSVYTPQLLEQCKTCEETLEHEVLLSLPMEPYNYPTTDPGPVTLLTGFNRDHNLKIVEKLLQYNPHIKGILGQHGSKFMAFTHELSPIIEDLRRRDVYFLDPQTSIQPKTRKVCKKAEAKCGVIDINFPYPATEKDLDRAFEDLLDLINRSGWAICTIKAEPLQLGKLEEWLEKLGKKEISIIPVSEMLRLNSMRKKPKLKAKSSKKLKKIEKTHES